MIGHKAIRLALRTFLNAVPGLPAKAWENVRFVPAGASYMEEAYVPATNTLRGMIKLGTIDMTGLYVLRLFGQSGTGVNELEDLADALLAHFYAGVGIPTSASADLRVRGQPGPTRGELLNLETGYAMLVVTIPWRVLTLNPN